MFKVVPDQLRVSDGWVRCGQCDEVFDANAHLHPALATPSAPLASPAAEPVADYDWGPVAGTAAAELPAPPPTPPASQPVAEVTAFGEPERLVIADAPVAADPFLDQSPQELSGASEWAATVEFDAFADSLTSELHLPHTEPSFMAPVRAPSKFGRRLSASLVYSLAGVLGVTLLAQVLVQERDYIAAAEPALKPLLESVCLPLGCRVESLRNIEAVVIDSSSFAKASAHVYTLTFTLKNAGALPVATPALELSLTDAQDKVVVRRVVQSKEFTSTQTTLAAGDEVVATLPVQVKLTEGADTISGYRLFAFYP